MADRQPEEISISATAAKNEFGRLLEAAMRGGTVVITKHGAPQAVLISVERHERGAHPNRAAMEAMEASCNAMFDRMQTPEWQAGMQAAFNATPEQMGQAAVTAARMRSAARARGSHGKARQAAATARRRG